jgi:hypothetical protein
VGCYDRPLTLIFGFFAFTCFHLLSPAFTGRHVTGDGISAGVTRLGENGIGGWMIGTPVA